MSTPITPTPEDPMPASPFTLQDAESATTYIETSLVQARKSLAITRIVGALLVLVCLFETMWVTSNVQSNLQPSTAAQIADGSISQRLDDNSDDLRNSIAQKLPEFISQIPDQAIKQMPQLRENLESRFTTDLQGYATTASKNLDDNLDEYLNANKDEVKTALTGGKDTAAIHEIGNGVTQNVLETLKSTSDNGESLQDKLDASLVSMNQVKSQMDRLANGQNLTPQEKKTRHMIAIMAHSINLHTPSVDVAQAVSGAQDKVSSNL